MQRLAALFPKLAKNLPVLAGLACLGFIILWRAWLADDAYITFRTVDNFVHGLGLTWNPGERVQVYTHPLWMFLVSGAYALTHEIYHTVIYLSVGLTLIACCIYAFRIAPSRAGAVVGVALLALSRSFTDYSTSGLENPLSYLLLAVFAALYFPPEKREGRCFWLSLIASLAAVARLDTFLLYLPVLAGLLWSHFKNWKRLLLGQLPLVLWVGFSLFYYGFAFPNTAYAKLNTGIPLKDMLAQGGTYYLDALDRDPLILLVIGMALAGFAATWKKTHRLAPVILGILFYLGYIAYIGGDFMSGRFFTLPFFFSVILLAELIPLVRNRKMWFWAGSAVALAILCTRAPTFLPPGDPGVRIGEMGFTAVSENGVADERGFYFEGTGLIYDTPEHPMPIFPWIDDGLKARKAGETPVENESIGMFGFYSGPRVYIIDHLALADPLLARLPINRYNPWRIGHFYRMLPAGYLDTLRDGRDEFADRNLGEYYANLSLITRGNLFDPARLQAILAMNLGRYDHLIDRERYAGGG